MSRHSRWSLILASPRNLRYGTLVLLLVMVNQINDQLLDATLGQTLLYWGVRPVVLLSGLWLADGLVSRAFAGRMESPEWLKPVILVTAIGLLPLEGLPHQEVKIRLVVYDQDFHFGFWIFKRARLRCALFSPLSRCLPLGVGHRSSVIGHQGDLFLMTDD